MAQTGTDSCMSEHVEYVSNTFDMDMHVKEKPYKCYNCKLSYALDTDLKQHMLSHTAERPFQCGVCALCFAYIGGLKKHVTRYKLRCADFVNDENRDELLMRPHQCQVCNKRFIRGPHLKDHMMIHTGEKPYVCCKCNKGFARAHSLKIHSCNGKKSIYYLKQTLLRKNRKLRSSKRVIYNKIYSATCKDNDFVSDKILDVKPVTENVNSAVNEDSQEIAEEMLLMTQSDLNGSEFKDCEADAMVDIIPAIKKENFLVNDDNVLDAKPVIGKDNSLLEDNSQDTIVDKMDLEEPVIVQKFEHIVCDNKGNDLSEEQRMVTYLSDIPQETNVGEDTVAKQRPFQCVICVKRFKTRSNLTSHMMVHTGEKPHVCSVCGAKFARSNILKKHILKHHGDVIGGSWHEENSTSVTDYSENSNALLNDDSNSSTRDDNNGQNNCKSQQLQDDLRKRPFQCEVCKKRFLRGPHLKDHMMIHTGERPHVCGKCNTGFARAHTLKIHSCKGKKSVYYLKSLLKNNHKLRSSKCVNYKKKDLATCEVNNFEGDRILDVKPVTENKNCAVNEDSQKNANEATAESDLNRSEIEGCEEDAMVDVIPAIKKENFFVNDVSQDTIIDAGSENCQMTQSVMNRAEFKDSEEVNVLDVKPVIGKDNSPQEEDSQDTLVDKMDLEEPVIVQKFEDVDSDNKGNDLSEEQSIVMYLSDIPQETDVREDTVAKQRPFQCVICLKRFKTRSNLTSHMIVHTGEKPHVCSICGAKYAGSYHLKKHILKCHEDVIRVSCQEENLASVTEYSENSNSLLNDDSKSGRKVNDNSQDNCKSQKIPNDFQERPFQCKLCNYRFLRNTHLKDHMLTHTGERPYVCGKCNRGFARAHTLKIHRCKGKGSMYDSYLDAIVKNNRKMRSSNSTNKDFTTCKVNDFEGDNMLVGKPSTENEDSQETANKTLLTAQSHLNRSELEDFEGDSVLDNCKRPKKSNEGEVKGTTNIFDDSPERSLDSENAHSQLNNDNTWSGEKTDSFCDKNLVTSKKDTVKFKPVANGSDSDRPFKCDLCGKCLKRKSHLKEHMATHTGERPFPCKFCVGLRYARLSGLKTHMLNHHGTLPRPYVCNVCGERYALLNELKHHILDYHESESGTQMEISQSLDSDHSNSKLNDDSRCEGKVDDDSENQMISDKDAIRFEPKINLSNPSKPFECEECGLCVRSVGHLKEHIITHTGVKPFACKYCDNKYTRRYALKVHIETKHTFELKNNKEGSDVEGSTSFDSERVDNETDVCDKADEGQMCHICGEKRNWKCLRKHVAKHASEKIECQICNKVLKNLVTFRSHQMIHTGEKPYKCNICNKRFRQASTLQQHQLGTHSTVKRFACKLCDEAFSYRRSLKIHMLKHSGIKPYQCEYCGKQYYQKSGLTYHIQSHSGERRYQCLTCGKRFLTRSCLHSHKYMHGEHRFLCSLCGKSFYCKKHLNQHMRSHRNDNRSVE